ncbi:hypothetical protein CQP30_06580 [Yersinia pestis]|uniref:Uncharacterized protein n=3 Tax=Yersinia pestis TaxID=632 RepID=A0A3G5KZ90_YERPE|nr:hypothetical [Yersinia pestis KIM10+]ABG15620.1 conserved hypothetical protein [Yersinia pestis Antiqua]ABP38671.1 conserved hypothetical protein [Yersinia pestis Pestoides F]ADW00764.1 hypothetical protein YPC_4366 [Yersinia pestis biovar Medievalis str. Harbin 35]AEL72184.1 hypothetical protein A1122_07645 [Yersinia pestis A1122]AYW83881.1 hypothetical protein EGX42_13550 [Yersinia pestis]EEO74410.1 hypothetical protein YP516_4006 [Yersinia pestis Nepal516]EEO79443.1 hypothetical protei
MVFSSDFMGYVLHLMWINNLLRQLNACGNLCNIFGGGRAYHHFVTHISPKPTHMIGGLRAISLRL